MKRAKRGEWTDITERGPGYTDVRPLRMVFRGENGLYFEISRISPHSRWLLRCEPFGILAEELNHNDLVAAQSQAINRLRRELFRITHDLDIAQRRIA